MGKQFNSKTIKYILGLLLIPLIWYVGINLINGSSKYTFGLIAMILAMFIAALLMARKLPLQNVKSIVLDSEKPPTSKYYLLTAILMILMPMGGLALNSGFSGFGDTGSGGIFGDFSHPAYYIIGLINGLLLLIPPLKDTRLRLLLFYLKAVGLTYILYFFIVFLPILPLGAVGIIFYGLGVFVWAPVAAAFWQIVHMVKEWMFISKVWGASNGKYNSKAHLSLTAILLIGLITLPLFMTAAFLGDRGNFETAAAYLSHQPAKDSEEVNLGRLQRTLKNMKGDLEPIRGFMSFSSGNTPLISSLYSRLVLDGKVVSQNNVMALENLFFDAGHDLSSNINNNGLVHHDVNLISMDSKTTYDKASDVYRTWVNLKLRNNGDFGDGEYITTFKLPEGAYISDYYLDVFGTRKSGILTDRRAALFIYNKIVNTRKDPGLLHYIGKNTLELRVFPFQAKEERLTGFEIIHKERFHLEIDRKTISANGNAVGEYVSFEGGAFVTASEKAGLPSSNRQSQYYFVIDNSKNSDIKWHVSQVDAYVKANKITNANVVLTNYKTDFYTLSNMDKAKNTGKYGFNLNLAVRQILSNQDKSSFPIIIAVTDNMPRAVFPRDVYPLADNFPESRYFYRLNHNLSLTPFSFDDNKAGTVGDSPILSPALNYKGSFIRNDGKSEIVHMDNGATSFNPTGDLYMDALLLDVMQQNARLGMAVDPIELVRTSFRQRILTPQTAFIVVETAEQEEELFDVQEKIMNSNMDPSLITLDEPPLFVVILIALGFLGLIKTKFFKRRGITSQLS